MPPPKKRSGKTRFESKIHLKPQGAIKQNVYQGSKVRKKPHK